MAATKTSLSLRVSPGDAENLRTKAADRGLSISALLEQSAKLQMLQEQTAAQVTGSELAGEVFQAVNLAACLAASREDLARPEGETLLAELILQAVAPALYLRAKASRDDLSGRALERLEEDTAELLEEFKALSAFGPSKEARRNLGETWLEDFRPAFGVPQVDTTAPRQSSHKPRQSGAKRRSGS